MRRAFNSALDAYWRFLADDGWAIASHIALSALMAMFPFFIVLTSLAGFFFGSSDLADEVAKLMLATWPEEVAGPIIKAIHEVLTTTHTGALTLGLLFALFFASSGVESLRIGLNRAYGVAETRHWILLRLESIGYVLIAAVSSLALGFLIVLGPLLFRTALRYAPWLEPLEGKFTFFRFAVASVVLTVALFVAHKWLAAGRRLRPLSRRVFLHLRQHLCRSRLGHGGARVPVFDGVDLRLWRRAQFGDHSAARRRGAIKRLRPTHRRSPRQRRPASAVPFAGR